MRLRDHRFGSAFGRSPTIHASLPGRGLLCLALLGASISHALAAPAVSFSPNPVAFGNQLVGRQAIRTLTIQNSGDASLTVNSISLTGANAGDFGFAHSCRTVAPGQACYVAVLFTAGAAGDRSATLSVSTNAPGSPQTVALSGTGVATLPPVPPPPVPPPPPPGPVFTPAVTFSPSPVAFGNQLIATQETRTLQILNSGGANLTLGAISIAGADAAHFSIVHSCTGRSLAPGQSCFVAVDFGRATVGTSNATLILNSNAPGSPQTVALSGTGVATLPPVPPPPVPPPPPPGPVFTPAVTFDPSPVAFGNQRVGAQAIRTLAIRNTGGANLTINSISVAGANASDFSIVYSCSTLRPGESCYVSVTFRAGGLGSRSASVVVNTNAPGSPQTVSLTGTGT